MKYIKLLSYLNINRVKVRPPVIVFAVIYSVFPLFLIIGKILREADRLKIYDGNLQKMVFTEQTAMSLADLWLRSYYYYFPIIAGLLLAILPIVWIMIDRHGSNSQWTLLRVPYGSIYYWLRIIRLPFCIMVLYTASQLLVQLLVYRIYCAVIPTANRPAELLQVTMTVGASKTGIISSLNYLPFYFIYYLLPLLLIAVITLTFYNGRRMFHRLIRKIVFRRNDKEKKKMLEFRNVTMTYALQPVLKNINIQIGPGEIVGLLGENGAGKTTIIKLILGLINTRSGEILLDGHPISEKDMERFAFATSEHTHFPRLTAREHALFYKEQFPKFNMKRFESLMGFFQLPYNTKLAHLSMGQKNQIETVLALSQGADYILLDEPFASNDIFIREDFYRLVLGLLEPNETILLSTHLIEEVQNFVSRVLIIKNKHLIADATAEQVEETGETLKEFISKTYGHDTGRVTEFLRKEEG